MFSRKSADLIDRAIRLPRCFHLVRRPSPRVPTERNDGCSYGEPVGTRRVYQMTYCCARLRGSASNGRNCLYLVMTKDIRVSRSAQFKLYSPRYQETLKTPASRTRRFSRGSSITKLSNDSIGRKLFVLPRVITPKGMIGTRYSRYSRFHRH